MPEAGYLPIPQKLARAGVKDMVRISDARMSGTAYGSIVLHVTPDAASGGPLAKVRNGDHIRLSVKERRIDLLVPPDELARRPVAPPPVPERGYARLYRQRNPAGRPRLRLQLPAQTPARAGLGRMFSAREGFAPNQRHEEWAELSDRKASGNSAGLGLKSSCARLRPRRIRTRASHRVYPPGKGETAMPFYEKGDVRIRYEEAGSGFPLLVTPGGGLNSRVSNWPTAVFNAPEALKNDFRVITMDQRNANGGESTGPIPTGDPWEAFADDQLGLMDHLGIREFFYMGYCIGGCFAGKLLQRAPGRVAAAVFCQTVGHRPELPDYMYDSGKDVWAPELLPRRPELNMAQVEQYLHNLYRVNPDFLYSVPRDFIRNCRTPMLVLPDDTPAHPLQTSIDVAALAPNAEITVFPWRDPPELKERTINRVRSFLKAHQPMRAAAQ